MNTDPMKTESNSLKATKKNGLPKIWKTFINYFAAHVTHLTGPF